MCPWQVLAVSLQSPDGELASIQNFVMYAMELNFASNFTEKERFTLYYYSA